MIDENTKAAELEKQANALLSHIEEATNRFVESTGKKIADLSKDLDALNREFDVTEAELEEIGMDAGKELSQTAEEIEKELQDHQDDQ